MVAIVDEDDDDDDVVVVAVVAVVVDGGGVGVSSKRSSGMLVGDDCPRNDYWKSIHDKIAQQCRLSECRAAQPAGG